jgi:di/tricarboxylate transporter
MLGHLSAGNTDQPGAPQRRGKHGVERVGAEPRRDANGVFALTSTPKVPLAVGGVDGKDEAVVRAQLVGRARPPWLAVSTVFTKSAIASNRSILDLAPLQKWKNVIQIQILAPVDARAYAFSPIHGISPAWVSLGTGILCLSPPMGLISGKDFSERINVVTLIYIAGILGLGALVADSGLSRVVSADLVLRFPLASGHPLANLAVLSAIDAGLAALTTVTGVPAVLTPLAGDFAAATGLPLLSVLMLQVVVFSTVFLPFESPPMMIALQIGNVGARPAAKLCLALAAITIVALLPLDYFWWRLLGYLP